MKAGDDAWFEAKVRELDLIKHDPALHQPKDERVQKIVEQIAALEKQTLEACFGVKR